MKLSKTKSQEIRKDMEVTSIIYDIMEELDYEIRINTKLLPDKLVKVNIVVPDSFLSRMPSNYGVRAYGKFNFSDSNENITTFNVLDTKFYGTRNQLEVELIPMYFSNKWTSDQSFEAIITIGYSLGQNPSMGRITGDCCEKLRYPLHFSTDNCDLNPINKEFTSIPTTHSIPGVGPRPHLGLDLKAKSGDPVVAVAEGEVVITQADPNATGWGNYIVLLHKSHTCNYKTLYGHLSERLITSGKVKKGDIIGKVGVTGLADGPHLHFEYIKNGDATLKRGADRYDPLTCFEPSPIVRGKALLYVPACGRGCTGSVGWGETVTIKLFSVGDDIPILESSVNVSHALGPFPSCLNPNPAENLVVCLPVGHYLMKVYYKNMPLNNFPAEITIVKDQCNVVRIS